jgi:hypothetical protein
MSVDSAASLLFAISADSSDAESNIARFRTLMGKDLDDLAADFDNWSNKVLGNLTTVSGALTAGTSALAAAVLAVGGVLNNAADKYAEYVGEIAKGSSITGVSAEQMSGLHFAAEHTGVSFDALTRGIAYFESQVVKANAGGEEQTKMFNRMGISQAAVRDGEKDIIPLLMQTANWFHNAASGTEQAAMAKEALSRSGTTLLPILRLGAEGIKEFAEEARQMGLVIGQKDVEAFKEHRAAMASVKAEWEALWVTLGRKVLPLFTELGSMYTALMETLKSGSQGSNGFDTILKLPLTWVANVLAADEKTSRFVKTLAALKGSEGLQDLGEHTKTVKAEFYGLSEMLGHVKLQLAGQTDEESKLTQELLNMDAAVDKARQQFTKLGAEGKLSADTVSREVQALLQLPQVIAALGIKMQQEINQKRTQAVQQSGDDLRKRILGQEETTVEQQRALWAAEVTELRDRLTKEKLLTEDNVTLLEQLTTAGYARIARAKQDAIQRAGEDIEKRTAAQREHTYEEDVAAWNREVKALVDELAKKGELTAENWVALNILDQAGRDKLKATREQAFAREVMQLDQHLKQLVSEQTSSQEKLWLTYQQDVARYSKAEEDKAKKTASTEAEIQLIEQRFSDARKALLNKYNVDLQALLNSQGWKGVLGSQFGNLIKTDERLWKEWSASTKQSHLIVKDSLAALNTLGKETFTSFANGMGNNAANAIVYSTSVGKAMKSALAATLESLSAQALVETIFETAWGFKCLAMQDYTGAGNAFTAAAIFVTVGGAAAISGRAIAPSSTSSSSSSASTASSSTDSSSTSSGSSSNSNLTVIVEGHLVGWTNINELTAALNDAVLNQDVTLTSTNTKTGVQVTQ